MKILIVENEFYLAQSISAKLNNFGYECEIIPLIDDALQSHGADIILLSLSGTNQNIYPFIEKFKNSIIILMIPYINDETVEKPLKAGAKDYIIKPFMIDELIRKIEHYNVFSQLYNEVKFYKDYFTQSLINPSCTFNGKIVFPLIIKSPSQKLIDMHVSSYAIQKKLPINFISLYDNPNIKEIPYGIKKNQLAYIIGFETLKKEEKSALIKSLKNTPVFLSCLGGEISEFSNVYEIGLKELSVELQNDILNINEYIRTMILKYEDKYPDTELSKRLGLSRKSLWEKRKKFGITKKK